MPDSDMPWWQQQRWDRATGSATVVASPTCLYRPGQLVVATAAVDLIGDVLEGDYAGEQDAGLDALAEVGIQRWRVTTDDALPDVVLRLRSLAVQRTGDAAGTGLPAISLNHVLGGAPRWLGGPATHPRSTPLAADLPGIRADREPDLAVLDTGFDPAVDQTHPAVAAALRPDTDDADDLTAPAGGPLLAEAGHGTFICGLVLRVAPGLVIDPGRVLDADGFGDDVSVALELTETSVPVVNLSLGGYTFDDAPPPALAAVIAALGRDRVVVAAAGNEGSTRPFWPAALKQVLAVAAVADPVDPAPTAWTNQGRWVDVCTQGEDLLSTYVVGDFPTGPTSREEFRGQPWALWSGTSFAAPVVAAVLAAAVRDAAGTLSAAAACRQLLAGLSPVPGHPGLGLLLTPPTDLRAP